jgi:hypothetical protein
MPPKKIRANTDVRNQALNSLLGTPADINARRKHGQMSADDVKLANYLHAAAGNQGKMRGVGSEADYADNRNKLTNKMATVKVGMERKRKERQERSTLRGITSRPSARQRPPGKSVWGSGG